MSEQTPKLHAIPHPILEARKAIAILRSEGVEISQNFEKALPGYALDLFREGQEVTVDLLVAAARQGEAFLKSPPQAKPEDPLLAYERIVAGFDAYKGKRCHEQLLAASKLGDNEKIRFLAAQGTDAAAQDNEAIVAAARNGRSDTVRLLIELGAAATARDNYPLKVAAQNGHIDTLRLLIEQGADVRAQQNYALIHAVQNGHADAARLLIEHGADVSAQSNSAIVYAALNGRADTVRLLIEHGADATAQNDCALISAAQNGHNEVMLVLLAQGAEADAQNSWAVKCAARNGHTDTVRLLIEHGADATAQDGSAIISAAESGHNDTIRLLIEHGAEVSAQDNWAIITAARNGHADTVRLLMEQGAEVRAQSDSAIVLAASHGHTDTVRLLIKLGAEVSAQDNWAITSAAQHGNADTVRLLIEHGADAGARGSLGIQLAMQLGHTEAARVLSDHGADLSVLSAESRKELNAYEKGAALWQQTVRMKPPLGLQAENPSYLKGACFEAVRHMLAREGYADSAVANSMAYHTAGLFQSENRVLQYLEKWGGAGKQPLHDLVQMIRLPREGNPNLKDWGDAVLKCGPSMARLVKFGDKVPSPMKSNDGKTWSTMNTRAACARFSFKKAAEHPALAAVCFEHDVDEDDFNQALDLVQKSKPLEKTVPDIKIDGSKFGAEGARFYRLAADDIRGLFLGEMTDCCQSIGNVGGSCAEHGYISKDSGFYVVENAKGRIVGQTWAWRGQKGEMCFDSLETLGSHVTADQWKHILQETAKELGARQDHNITALHVGAGGATPASSLRRHFTTSATATPKGYTGYRDSKGAQIRVWKRGI